MQDWPEKCSRCQRQRPIVGWGKEYLCRECLEIRLQERLSPIKKLLRQAGRSKPDGQGEVG